MTDLRLSNWNYVIEAGKYAFMTLAVLIANENSMFLFRYDWFKIFGYYFIILICVGSIYEIIIYYLIKVLKKEHIKNGKSN